VDFIVSFMACIKVQKMEGFNLLQGPSAVFAAGTCKLVVITSGGKSLKWMIVR
jgi:hypothetical protein